jgi:HAE1 family hydrophobic/amphiphilic exporter-1
VATAWLFIVIPKGFFPEEDIGPDQFVTTEAAEDTSFPKWCACRSVPPRSSATTRRWPRSIRSTAGGAQNTGRMFITLKPRAERADETGGRATAQANCGGARHPIVSCGRSQNLQLGGDPARRSYQYILQSVRADELNEWATRLQERLRDDPMFRDVTSDAQLRGLQAQLKIDRDRANALGVSIEAVRSALVQRLWRTPGVHHLPAHRQLPGHHGGGPEAKQDESAVANLYVRASTGALVPLSAFTTVERTVGPTSINHVGQLQAVTVSFNLAPGTALGDATAKIDKAREAIQMPASIISTYGGDAAVFKSSQGSQLILIIAALLVIYVLLGVLYESYIHPITILAWACPRRQWGRWPR